LAKDLTRKSASGLDITAVSGEGGSSLVWELSIFAALESFAFLTLYPIDARDRQAGSCRGIIIAYYACQIGTTSLPHVDIKYI
jgi:hypothetical protein